MQVIIMRGLPGCGKSTFVRKTFSVAKIFSADDYFLVNGEYKFDPTKIGDAHAWCLRQYLGALFSAEKFDANYTIVVDNTNTRAIEIAPYYQIAAAYKVTDIRIITIHCDPEVSAQRNIHGVPLEICQKMADAMAQERIPPWWNHEEIGAPVPVALHKPLPPVDLEAVNAQLTKGTFRVEFTEIGPGVRLAKLVPYTQAELIKTTDCPICHAKAGEKCDAGLHG